MAENGIKPPKVLVAGSVVIIGGAGLLLSAFIAALVDELNPFALMGGLMMLPWCVVLAVQQYRGTFHGSPSGVLTASIFLYAAGGLVVLGTLVTVLDFLREGDALGNIITWVWIPLGMAGLFVVLGSADLWWASQLRRAYASGLASRKRGGVTGREGILVMGILAVMAGATVYMVGSTPPRYAEHIDAAGAPFRLPAGASDVSYHKGYRGSIRYEFNTDEDGFCRWVASKVASLESDSAGVGLKEITGGFTIRRYSGWVPESDGPEEATITDGLYYSWSREDKGVYAAYDRSTCRAYYDAHFH